MLLVFLSGFENVLSIGTSLYKRMVLFSASWSAMSYNFAISQQLKLDDPVNELLVSGDYLHTHHAWVCVCVCVCVW